METEIRISDEFFTMVKVPPIYGACIGYQPNGKKWDMKMFDIESVDENFIPHNATIFRLVQVRNKKYIKCKRYNDERYLRHDKRFWIKFSFSNDQKMDPVIVTAKYNIGDYLIPLTTDLLITKYTYAGEFRKKYKFNIIRTRILSKNE